MDEKQLTEIETLVGNFLEILGVRAEIDSKDISDEERTVVEVVLQGEDLQDLIGFHGKNLDSLQKLVNVAYNNHRETPINIQIDINGYKKKREEYLKSVAERALIQVKDSKQMMTLPPMKASERRIIHMILKEEPGITTESEGQEPNRSIVIKPV